MVVLVVYLQEICLSVVYLVWPVVPWVVIFVVFFGGVVSVWCLLFFILLAVICCFEVLYWVLDFSLIFLFGNLFFS